MSGTGEDISQVHWKQQWLENGTLYFHVSMTESELLAQTTQPTAREPAHVLHEHMHLLHISVMVSYEHLNLENAVVDVPGSTCEYMENVYRNTVSVTFSLPVSLTAFAWSFAV